jgi:hypothetical protein
MKPVDPKTYPGEIVSYDPGLEGLQPQQQLPPDAAPALRWCDQTEAANAPGDGQTQSLANFAAHYVASGVSGT